MLQWQWHQHRHALLLCHQIFPFSHHTRTAHASTPSGSLSLPKPTSPLSLSLSLSLSALPPTADPVTATPPQDTGDGGPIELFPSPPTIFATTDDPSPLQVATSLLLTGAITVFLFRSIRRRARRAKELKFRSSGTEKTLKEDALERLKEMGSAPVEVEQKPPSAIQALLGGISAGVIALILYKFTTTIEAALNRQTISDNFSVRQITITIRTIVNGLCYLATFVFGVNSFGLFLYSAQLAIDSFKGGGTSGDASKTKATGESVGLDSASEDATNGDESSNQENQNLDNIQNESQ